MSIALMTLAWKSDFQSGKKMVLLALCDNANDQGECFPSISMLAGKCSMSERSVFSHVASLEEDGAIKRETRPGRSTVYHLDPCKFCTPTPANSAGVTPATVAPPPLQILQVTPATISPTPATVAPITIKEPSSNPKDKKKEPDRLDLLSDVDSQIVSDWMQVRLAKKAGTLTATAVSGLRREAGKAGLTCEAAVQACCEFGWQGFNAGWYSQRVGAQQTRQASGETAYQRNMRERMQQFAPGVAAKAPGSSNFFEMEAIDVTARRLG